MEPAIETRSLTVAYGAGAGVFDLDLSVERGEVFGFLGPNGAGKTTTIRILLDLLRPVRGSALVLGQPVCSGGGNLRRRIGYLPGDLALFGALRGDSTLDLFARLFGRPPIRRDETLDRLGFPRHALARRVKTYSTGMRQMLGITIALQHDPELLILDEPTSGLDPLVRDTFLTLIRECRGRGQTVFLSSHVLFEVERCADRVGIIHRGRLRTISRVDELQLSRQRVVTLRFADGRTESFESEQQPRLLLEQLLGRVAGTADGKVVDVEIRPLGLDAIFKRIVRAAEP